MAASGLHRRHRAFRRTGDRRRDDLRLGRRGRIALLCDVERHELASAHVGRSDSGLVKLLPLTTAQAVETTELWLPYLVRCTERLGNPLAVSLAEIEEGECTVHLVVASGAQTVAAIGTRWFEHRLAVQAHWCGGHGKAIYAVVPQLEDYARSLGATRLYMTGRKGWSRLLPDYRVEQITIGKAL
jgi:hypothetical protein